jgi:centrin-3
MRALGFDVPKEEVQRLMTEHDLEGKGEVGYSAFEEIMRDKFADRDPDEEISKAFRLFDEESSGTISVRNLRRICKELGEALSDDELRAMVEEFDRDEDGEISEEEFFAIMRSTSLY